MSIFPVIGEVNQLRLAVEGFIEWGLVVDRVVYGLIVSESVEPV